MWHDWSNSFECAIPVDVGALYRTAVAATAALVAGTFFQELRRAA
jgi:hypothetical protein